MKKSQFTLSERPEKWNRTSDRNIPSLQKRLEWALNDENRSHWYNACFELLTNDELRQAFVELESCRNGDGVLPDGIVRTVHAALREVGRFTSAAPMMAQDFYYEIARRTVQRLG